MDEYRCRYYGDVIDLYHAYTHALERELRQLKANAHAITNVKGLKEMLDRPKGTIELKEYLDNKDTENLKLYIQKNFKWIDEDVINAVCKKLID